MANATKIIKDWCASCGMPEPSDGECHALTVALAPSLLAGVSAPAGDADTTTKEQYRRMFGAACEALGLINEALDLDPEDGGAEPILEAIAELKVKADARDAVSQAVRDYHFALDTRQHGGVAAGYATLVANRLEKHKN